MAQTNTRTLPFRPRARMLLLLGDQLIRDPGIAVFELVKNAYDADAASAKVTMSNITDRGRGLIIVEDSGTGMDYETVANVWLEPGTDFRAEQRQRHERTPKYARLPLGEKGVGRFAAHKLGTYIKLVTRARNQPEVVLELNWDDFIKPRYLNDVPVTISEREGEVFTGRRTGTRIEITKLRETWDRRMVRELARAVTSICSPFEEEGEFRVDLVLTDHEDWLQNLLTVQEVLDYSLFRARCTIEGRANDPSDTKLSYRYEFVPFPAMDKVKGRKELRQNIRLPSYVQTNDIRDQVGPLHMDLYIYDLEPRILSLGVTDKKGLREFLKSNGGIRVYRGGIRVYDYGEPGNDWLNLGGERVNIPTKRISNNLVIGAVSLDISKSVGLVEKTNREGFVENTAFRAFWQTIDFAVTQIEAERNRDKKRIRDAYSGKRMKEPVLEDLTELRELVEKKGLTEELEPYLNRIEGDFLLIRDRFLTSASAGLSLSVVIHEVEKGVDELAKAVKEDRASPRVRQLAKHLADLVEGFASLIRRSGVSLEKASSLISQAAFNTELRLRNHGVKLVTSLAEGDFQAKCSRRLTISTLMNLIDNSIWWLDNRWGQQENKKTIYVGTSNEFAHGRAIVVADNGPGFIDPPEYLTEPFISRKPDGMGLGLHLADQVMRAQGGELAFPASEDVSLPLGFDGAVVALVFGGTTK